MANANPSFCHLMLPTVLIVDDQPENLTILGDLLEVEYQVRVANSGARALRTASNSPRPELILLDVMMPDMDGYEVLRRLRANPETADIPVIFVTALDRAGDEERGLALGAVDYITKPINPAIVLARLHTQIQLQQALSALREQNTDLEAEVRRRMHENQIVQDVSMRALASLAETRDNETGNHIRRTQGYIDVLARALAVADGDTSLTRSDIIELLVKAAPLHDIGKVGIPDHILNKPGPLDAEEWRLMRMHPEIGANAIEHAIADEENHSPLAFLHVAIDIAYSHHEKWDGSGYPAGLNGATIPLAARLMAIADVFDALISRRIYKPPLAHEEALRIISEGRGTHFDPHLVDLFVANFDDIRAIARRYSETGEGDG
jgi:putative two-component system response regulator